MSKSVSNLSTLDTSSQYNKIIPLAASTNAPFEQTFRITICLPRDQLFVVRVGAKTKLRQLLETVCVSKQLDRDKFEFRHPGKRSPLHLTPMSNDNSLFLIQMARRRTTTK